MERISILNTRQVRRMGIRIHTGPLSCYTRGKDTIVVSGATVIECLRNLTEQFPDLKLLDNDGRLLAHIDIWLNNEIVYPNLMDKQVKSDDEIYMSFMTFGG